MRCLFLRSFLLDVRVKNFSDFDLNNEFLIDDQAIHQGKPKFLTQYDSLGQFFYSTEYDYFQFKTISRSFNWKTAKNMLINMRKQKSIIVKIISYFPSLFCSHARKIIVKKCVLKSIYFEPLFINTSVSQIIRTNFIYIRNFIFNL